MTTIKDLISEEALDMAVDAVGTAYVMRREDAAGEARYSLIGTSAAYEELAIRALRSGHIDKADFAPGTLIWEGIREKNLEKILERAARMGYSVRHLE